MNDEGGVTFILMELNEIKEKIQGQKFNSIAFLNVFCKEINYSLLSKKCVNHSNNFLILWLERIIYDEIGMYFCFIVTVCFR